MAQDPEGNIIFGLIDLTDWGGPKKTLALEKRINLCIECMDSGQLHEDFPQAKGKRVAIRLYFGEQPDEHGLRFLTAVEERLKEFGIGFEYQKYEG